MSLSILSATAASNWLQRRMRQIAVTSVDRAIVRAIVAPRLDAIGHVRHCRAPLEQHSKLTPPQRIQQTRGSAAETDITIPHEHSRTGIASSPFNVASRDVARCSQDAASTYSHLHPRQNAGQRNGEKRGGTLASTLSAWGRNPTRC